MKIYCSKCGECLGDTDDFVSYSEEDGKKYCFDCAYKIRMAKDNARKNVKLIKIRQQYPMTVMIPDEVLAYCLQGGTAGFKVIKISDLQKYETSCGAVGNKKFQCTNSSLFKNKLKHRLCLSRTG